MLESFLFVKTVANTQAFPLARRAQNEGREDGYNGTYQYSLNMLFLRGLNRPIGGFRLEARKSRSKIGTCKPHGKGSVSHSMLVWLSS